MMRAWTALLLLLVCAAAGAEQFVRAPGFIVHYVAINSTEVTAEVARQFGIERSRKRGLLVLNAQREDAQGRTTPVPATATGTARSLIGHVQNLSLRAVREGESHYVIAEFQTVNLEHLIFELQLTPQGGGAIPIKFKQQFYTD